MFSKKRLLSKYNELAESYSIRHDAVKERMEKRRVETANMKKTFNEKTNSLNRLRNK